MNPDPRVFAKILLAEQMIAWALFRAGEPVEQIGRAIGRSPKQARAVLYGGEV